MDVLMYHGFSSYLSDIRFGLAISVFFTVLAFGACRFHAFRHFLPHYLRPYAHSFISSLRSYGITRITSFSA
jgi:hypothetical protein